MGRYIQQISLVPFSTADMWVGWELEGVEGNIEGLVIAADLNEAQLARLGVYEFQFIPAAYVSEMRIEVKKKSVDPRNSGSETDHSNVSTARTINVARNSSS